MGNGNWYCNILDSIFIFYKFLYFLLSLAMNRAFACIATIVIVLYYNTPVRFSKMRLV